MKAREIDEMLGIKARLAIVATLAAGRRLTFSELKAATGLADGNLHVQTGKLREVGYLHAVKERGDTRPVTVFELTERGLDRFRDHVMALQEAFSRRPGVGPGRNDAMVW